jgi:hypothetical protein
VAERGNGDVAAYLGGHRLRRHVDRRTLLARRRADPCRHGIRPHDGPALREAAKADLARRVAEPLYAPLLPPQMTAPRGLQDWLRKTGLDDYGVIGNRL